MMLLMICTRAVGMAIWYIGAPAHESGNPYGIVVATVRLFLLNLLVLRLTLVNRL